MATGSSSQTLGSSSALKSFLEFQLFSRRTVAVGSRDKLAQCRRQEHVAPGGWSQVRASRDSITRALATCSFTAADTVYSFAGADACVYCGIRSNVFDHKHGSGSSVGRSSRNRCGRCSGRICTQSRGMMNRSRQLDLGMPENKSSKCTKASLSSSTCGDTTGSEGVFTIHHGTHWKREHAGHNRKSKSGTLFEPCGAYAVFTEGSSASQITAVKIMDIISRFPSCDGQAADTVSAYTPVKIGGSSQTAQIFSSSTTHMAKIMREN